MAISRLAGATDGAVREQPAASWRDFCDALRRHGRAAAHRRPVEGGDAGVAVEGGGAEREGRGGAVKAERRLRALESGCLRREWHIAFRGRS